LMADTTQCDLLWRHSDHLFRNDVWWHHI
jgi:hypothetical protein